MKPNQFPMAIVKEIVLNDLGEVTGAKVLKGRTRETVQRHVSSLVPLLRSADGDLTSSESEPAMPDMEEVLNRFGIRTSPVAVESRSRPTRAAALGSRELTRKHLSL